MFDPVINSLASVTCLVEFDCDDDLAFFICLSLVARLSSQSVVLFQSTKTVRLRGFVIFNSVGKNPTAKFFVSF